MIHVKYVHKIFMPRRIMVPQLVYQMNYFPFSDSCGSILVASDKTQNISTPNYPNQYSSNLTCNWKITTSKDYLVKLETGFVSNDTCCERLEVSDFGRKVCCHTTSIFYKLCSPNVETRELESNTACNV